MSMPARHHSQHAHHGEVLVVERPATALLGQVKIAEDLPLHADGYEDVQQPLVLVRRPPPAGPVPHVRQLGRGLTIRFSVECSSSPLSTARTAANSCGTLLGFGPTPGTWMSDMDRA
jgi:hypothetical protein